MSKDETPFKLADLHKRAPWWPLGPWETWHRIRAGQMAAIRDGKRIFVTTSLLRQYLAEHGMKVSCAVCTRRMVAMDTRAR